MLSLFLQSLLEAYILDENKPEVKRMEVFKFYGTFARTMLTMFEITLGNWMPPCRALVENVNEFYMLFSLAHKLVIGFSVVAVITGVFIQETFKVATTDDKIMVMSKERASKTHKNKMDALFNYADEDGDGFLNPDEYAAVLADPEVRTWLAAMELDVRDKETLFGLLDTNMDGMISRQELVEGVGRLKGGARSIELVSVQKSSRELLKILRKAYEKPEVLQGEMSPRPN